MTLGIPLPTRHGWGLLLGVMPLCALGVLSIEAIYRGDGLLSSEAMKQIVFIVVGTAGMLAALSIGYHRIGRFAYPLFGLCLVLLALLVIDRWVDLPFVPSRRATRRWIAVKSIQIQPSELMKIAYVLALAWYLRFRKNYRTLGGLVVPFAITLVPMALIKMQPDLGTVLLFLPVLFAMLFAAGARTKHLAVIILLGLLAAPVFWVKIQTYQRLRLAGVVLQSGALRDYLEAKPRRLMTDRSSRWDCLRPEDQDADRWRSELVEWRTRSGYQLVHSKTAVGSGGAFGYGCGHGAFVEDEDDKLLPEKQNDFIFAVVAQQWGLVGGLLLLGCYVLIVTVGFDAATLTQDPFGRLVAVGFSTMIAVQTLTNLWMTVGLGPITGVTLPFVSAGGSSLMASFLCIGLLISVAQHRPMLIAKPPFEFDEEPEPSPSPSTKRRYRPIA